MCEGNKMPGSDSWCALLRQHKSQEALQQGVVVLAQPTGGEGERIKEAGRSCV